MQFVPPRLDGSYLVVELTNRCSLACVHCSVSEAGHGHHARSGYLDTALFVGLVDDLVRVGGCFDSLVLFWLGEPLLHPHFDLIWRHAVRAAARHGTFSQVEVHSNATHLRPAKVRAALNDSEVRQVWHFSLDAVDAAAYAAIKGRDRLERVQAHVLAFLEAKARTGARWPRPVLQLILGENNVDQAEPFLRFWSERCRALGLAHRAAAGHVPDGDDVVIFFRQLDCPTAEAQAATNQVFRRELLRLGLSLPRGGPPVEVSAQNLHPCAGFWKSPVVSWQGELTACTRDNLLQNALGSLHERPFSELWWGPEMEARRARVADGDYGAHALCQTCFIPKSLNHGTISRDEIARVAAVRAAG